MARRSKSNQYERWIRTATISSFRARVSSWGDEQRGEQPKIEVQCTLDLIGVLEEDVRGIREVEIHVHPEDKVTVGTARPAAVGAIIGFQPFLHVVVSFTHREFDRVWSLALTGHLKFV